MALRYARYSGPVIWLTRFGGVCRRRSGPPPRPPTWPAMARGGGVSCNNADAAAKTRSCPSVCRLISSSKLIPHSLQKDA